MQWRTNPTLSRIKASRALTSSKATANRLRYLKANSTVIHPPSNSWIARRRDSNRRILVINRKTPISILETLDMTPSIQDSKHKGVGISLKIADIRLKIMITNLNTPGNRHNKPYLALKIRVISLITVATRVRIMIMSANTRASKHIKLATNLKIREIRL